MSIKRDEHVVRDVVVYDKECGGWYVSTKSLSDVLHEQHNEDWQKAQGYTSNDKHKVRVVGNIGHPRTGAKYIVGEK